MNVSAGASALPRTVAFSHRRALDLDGAQCPPAPYRRFWLVRYLLLAERAATHLASPVEPACLDVRHVERCPGNPEIPGKCNELIDWSRCRPTARPQVELASRSRYGIRERNRNSVN